MLLISYTPISGPIWSQKKLKLSGEQTHQMCCCHAATGRCYSVFSVTFSDEKSHSTEENLNFCSAFFLILQWLYGCLFWTTSEIVISFSVRHTERWICVSCTCGHIWLSYNSENEEDFTSCNIFPSLSTLHRHPLKETLTSALKYCPEWWLKLQWAQWGFHAPPHPVMLISYQQSFTSLFSPSLLDKRLSHSSQCEQEMI